MEHRTEKQIRAEIKLLTAGLKRLEEGVFPEVGAQSEALTRRAQARLLELRTELRALDDTPVVRFRRSPSEPPRRP